MVPPEAVTCHPSSLSLDNLSSLHKGGTSKSRQGLSLKQHTKAGSQSRIQSTASSHAKASNTYKSTAVTPFLRGPFHRPYIG